MRVLMLGWEFPPFIAGGLGTACAGLTRAMDGLGHEILFVLPKPVGRGDVSHVRLLSPTQLAEPASEDSPPPAAAVSRAPGRAPDVPARAATVHEASVERIEIEGTPGETVELERTEFAPLPASFSSPYADMDTPEFAQTMRRWWAQRGGEPATVQERLVSAQQMFEHAGLGGTLAATGLAGPVLGDEAREMIERPIGGHGSTYGSDLFGDAGRYARLAVALAAQHRFDVIHAHDWLTYPAGMAVAAATGKPLVVHVHATEFDRSGEHINQQVYDIERAGMHAADRIIAVSMLTKKICVTRYGADELKVDVVYNGVEQSRIQPESGARIEAKDKIVLFLGRITMQKGPEYFVRAAARALEKLENVKFVVAGSGDMATRMIEEAAALGIGDKVLFTGFLRGKDVERVYQMADCYVMPSVSEPFGIAPLEAMLHDVPVIISKQSGVAEVLTHALKVDFWDTDEMANKIVAVLRHPPLSSTLRTHGSFELRGLTWEGAATKCVRSYHAAALARG